MTVPQKLTTRYSEREPEVGVFVDREGEKIHFVNFSSNRFFSDNKVDIFRDTELVASVIIGKVANGVESFNLLLPPATKFLTLSFSNFRGYKFQQKIDLCPDSPYTIVKYAKNINENTPYMDSETEFGNLFGISGPSNPEIVFPDPYIYIGMYIVNPFPSNIGTENFSRLEDYEITHLGYSRKNYYGEFGGVVFGKNFDLRRRVRIKDRIETDIYPINIVPEPPAKRSIRVGVCLTKSNPDNVSVAIYGIVGLDVTGVTYEKLETGSHILVKNKENNTQGKLVSRDQEDHILLCLEEEFFFDYNDTKTGTKNTQLDFVNVVDGETYASGTKVFTFSWAADTSQDLFQTIDLPLTGFETNATIRYSVLSKEELLVYDTLGTVFECYWEGFSDKKFRIVGAGVIPINPNSHNLVVV